MALKGKLSSVLFPVNFVLLQRSTEGKVHSKNLKKKFRFSFTVKYGNLLETYLVPFGFNQEFILKRKHHSFSWCQSRQTVILNSIISVYFASDWILFSARLVRRGRLLYFSPTPPSSRGTQTSSPQLRSLDKIIIRLSTSAEKMCRDRRPGNRWVKCFCCSPLFFLIFLGHAWG